MLKPLRVLLPVLALVLLLPGAAGADTTAQTLPFSQNWSNTGLITVNDNWSGVPGIEGFRGDGLAGGTGVNPQTILVPDSPGVLDVNANQTNPNTFATGGATEFDITDDVVALTGSGTARAPYLKLYLNTTGQSGVTVSYNLRDIDGSTDNSVQPVALHFRVGNAGNFTDVPAAFVADASSGPSLATLVTPICVVLPAAANNQPLVEVRVMTTDAVGNDEWIGVDDIVVNTAGCGPPPNNLSINDVSLAEGNPPGTTTFTFTVSLSAPAGPGGVTFNIATADNTATVANNDYVTNSLTGQTIPAGSSTYAFNVTVNRDTTPEANETFFVNVTSVTGANVLDGQGTGTIQNDDVTLTPIHDIQGPGASSPIVGSVVTTTGIVTGVRSNGFFIQEPDATVDADPATSEGVLVFNGGGGPPPAAVVGALVQVTATVTEFVPTQDTLQPPLTELTTPSVIQLSTGNPLPAPVPLSATFPDPAGPHDQLERVEGMRVSLASLTVVGPTLGNINEANATATSSGVFYGVVTGVPRPFREAGIPAPDPPPSGGGTIPPIPRFDSNPERIRVDSDNLGGPLLDVGTGAVVTGLVGPLDYTFRTYTINPDPGATIGVAGGPTPTAVTAATGREFTVASYNMQRFFDTVNDPGIGEPVLTAAAFDMRLNKASLAIRNALRMPDIVGISEMENLTTLQALAARISADAVAAAQPDPEYDAYLVEGNDVGGIDVAFLVKTAEVAAGTPRVEVVEVVQELDGTLLVNPDSSTSILNDRPPLRLNAIIHHPNGASFPVTVIANHLRSLGDVNSEAPGPNGWPTDGARVRAKRQEQAEDLANLVQARQTADPNEHIILVGDFNAFEVNDGLGHSMGVIAGTPAPDNQTAVPGDGIDLVNPDLDNLYDSPPPAERYSYVFDGNAQNLDHILINAPLDADTLAHRAEHARINADFPETARNDGTTPVRLSDHDPLVAYFEVEGFQNADLSITKTDFPDPVVAGNNLTYFITVTNDGPDPAVNASWSDTLPAGTTFGSMPAVAGWSCTTGATVTCSNPSFGVGSASFNLTVAVDPAVAAGTVLSNTATATSDTEDPDSADLSATTTTTVVSFADLSVTKTDSPDPVNPGEIITYTITVANAAGSSNAATVSLSDPLPAETTFVSLSAPAGWSCTTPAVGTNGTVSCSIASLATGGSAVFTLTVAVDAGTLAGTVISNTATVTSASTDPNPGNESATATTDVVVSTADLSVAKVDTPDPVDPGTNLTYTITVTNAGPDAAASAELSDALPAGTTFVSLSAPAGWSCTTPAVGAGGTVSCSNTSFPVGSAVFTLVVQVAPSALPGTEITNLASVSSAVLDPDPKNQIGTATTTVAGSADLSVAKVDTPDPVAVGTSLTYTITVTNAGPNFAGDVALNDPLPVGTTFQSLSAPAGWTCSTPAVGAGGTVSCSIASFAPGSAVFTLTVGVDAGLANGTVLTNTATVTSSTTDSNPGNESASATTTVVVPTADLSVTKVDTPDPVNAGSNITYTITVANAGPDNAAGVALNDALPAGTNFQSLSAAAGWTCTTPAVGSPGAINCSIASFAPGSAVFTLTAGVDSGVANGTVLTNTATVTSTTADPNPGNESASATTTVTNSTVITATKTVSGDFNPGGTVTYTIVLTNTSGQAQADNPGDEFIDLLPAELTLVSADASSGTVATPAANTVTWNGPIPGGASVTITIEATINSGIPLGTTITNQGQVSYDSNGDGTNDSSTTTDDPATSGAENPTIFIVGGGQGVVEIPTLNEVGLALLALLLAFGGAVLMRRRARS